MTLTIEYIGHENIRSIELLNYLAHAAELRIIFQLEILMQMATHISCSLKSHQKLLQLQQLAIFFILVKRRDGDTVLLLEDVGMWRIVNKDYFR